uniref:Uncharacterized protein n=1 Tax=Anguilla anguilla TaxID=7936 RepID=A0A0E9PD62_ANGAN
MTDISCKKLSAKQQQKNSRWDGFPLALFPFIFQAVRNIYNISGNTLMDKNIDKTLTAMLRCKMVNRKALHL